MVGWAAGVLREKRHARPNAGTTRALLPAVFELQYAANGPTTTVLWGVDDSVPVEARDSIGPLQMGPFRGRCNRDNRDFALPIFNRANLDLVAPGEYIARLIRVRVKARILWHRQADRRPRLVGREKKSERGYFATIWKLCLAVRRVAAEQLGLNVGGAYESFAPGRSKCELVTSLIAGAAKNSLEPYHVVVPESWGPAFPYRGLFRGD